MSVTLLWRPCERGAAVGKRYEMDLLLTAFCTGDINGLELNSQAVPVLRALKKASIEGGDAEICMKEIIEAIEEHGRITLYTEY